MRVLIVGMQSSGASALAMTLGQLHGCLAFVDIYASHLAPELSVDLPAVAKVVLTEAFPLERHIQRFSPDRLILMLRHPVDNFKSLNSKPYRDDGGLIENKFRILEQTFIERKMFDLIILYEDFVADPHGILDDIRRLGWPAHSSFLAFARSYEDMKETNDRIDPGAAARCRYGSGNFHVGSLVADKVHLAPPDSSAAIVRELCPQVLAFYDGYVARVPNTTKGTEVTQGAVTFVDKRPANKPMARLGLSDILLLASNGLGAANPKYPVELRNGNRWCRGIPRGFALCPIRGTSPPEAIITGIEGAWFRRLVSEVWTHPSGPGTIINASFHNEAGNIVASTEMNVAPGGTGALDLPLRHASSGGLELRISVRLPPRSATDDYAGVHFLNPEIIS